MYRSCYDTQHSHIIVINSKHKVYSILDTTIKHERAENCSNNSYISGGRVSTPVQQKAKRYVVHLRDYLQLRHIPAFLIINDYTKDNSPIFINNDQL